MRGNWGADARQLRRIDLQCPGRSVRCASFHRSRLVRIFSQSFQPYASRYAGRRTNRDCVVALALVAGIRPAPLVRVEVSKFYYLVDRTFVAAADLFVIPQTNRRRTALFRSHALATLDDVDLIFRPDRSSAFRNACGPARLATTWRPGPRAWTRRSGAIGDWPQLPAGGSGELLVTPVAANTFSGSSPIFWRIDLKRLSERNGANSGAIPAPCNDDERCSHARSSSRMASSCAPSATCTCAMASPGR